MFERRHYNEIAKCISKVIDDDGNAADVLIVASLIEMFEKDNGNFSRDLFLDAIYRKAAERQGLI